ncbi:MAG TPA: hypothetical protein VFA77_05700 [Candidatus Eisenbacteria bacterium]|nr:hypothetical protein [Candidatus Eisenbacteria bacterium]
MEGLRGFWLLRAGDGSRSGGTPIAGRINHVVLVTSVQERGVHAASTTVTPGGHGLFGNTGHS